MLKIIVPKQDAWDEAAQEFVSFEGTELELEHSLVSLSKWERIFRKPFLGKEEKTDEEVLGYIAQMILTPDFPPEVVSHLSQQNIDDINAYINDPMTATTFPHANGEQSRETITAELIYYWMITYQIPFQCEHWHLNQLFTLIRVCNVKASKPKKRGRAELAAERAALNAQRRAQFNSRG